MRLRFLIGAMFLVPISFAGFSQNCVPTGLNNVVVTSSCSQVCRDLAFQIPDLRSTSDYTIINIPYQPYQYVTPGGTTDSKLYDDDTYSNVFSLPFPFCFYNSVYSKAVISSNGLITFDPAYASCPVGGAAWDIVSTIPFNGAGGNCSSSHYPRASIMGVFMDLDPRPGPTSSIISSPADRKIEWRVEGTAPCRRFVVSFYHIGVYQATICGTTTPATFQIVIYESTGVIDVFIQQKICNANGTNGTKAILGIQDFTRTLGKAALGKNADTPGWTSFNEGYRFVPSGGDSRFVSSELLAMDLTPLAVATIASTTPGLLDITFPNICSPSPSTQYIVKTTFAACDNPATLLIGLDTINVNRNSSLNASASSTNTLCGAPSGTIQVAVQAGMGVEPYTFVLNPGPSQVVQTGVSPMTFVNVAQGTHTVVVTDASGNCNSTITNIIVSRTNDLTATATPTATACPTSLDGSIQVVPTNGSAPYTFLLNPGSITQTGATANFTGLSAGIYAIDVTDASGCLSNLLPVTITSGPALTTTVSKTDVLCNGSSTGTITVTIPVVGTPPYQYSLDGVTWQASNIFPGLIAGTYTVYFLESNGCQGSQSITVSEPPALSASAATIGVVCNGQSNGIITVSSSGGILPYQYSIDGGTIWQSSNLFNVAAGSYTITIRDANNCTTTQTIFVTEPVVLTAFSANGAASCDGGNDGVITVTANGGNTGYQYSLDGVTFQPSNLFNVAPGNYTVTVKDNLGCITTFPTTVLLGSNFTLTRQTDPTICEGTSTQLQLNSNATQYAWTPATGLSSATIANPFANPIATTQYIVNATLGRCSGNDTVIVNVNTAPVPNAGADGFICFGQTYSLQASGGTQYSWSPTTYLDNPSISNPISIPTKDITYTLSVLSDINGCASLTTDQVRIDVTPPIKVRTFPYDTIGYSGDQFQLLAIPSDTDVINYTWTPATGLSDPRISNPIVTVGAIGDVVQYQVITSTIAGCKGQGFVTVRVYKGPDIYVPTGFTPNNDGKNDKFTPFPVGIKSYKYFRVFNRWGQMIFSTTTLNDGWDGKLGGRDQPSGVYVWMIEGVSKDDRIITKKGTVSLIR